MDFWGFCNFDFNFGTNDWFVPSFYFDTSSFFSNLSYFPSLQLPTIDFSPSLFSHSSTNSYTPSAENHTSVSTTNKLGTKTLGLNNTSLAGYNASAGQKLANIALNNSVGWTGYCARFVKTAISDANLGSYKSGHAYQMSSILRNNKNFKEISTKDVDVSELPAGCILVYNKGAQGYNKDYGHTEITTGDGRAVSDGITKHLTKKPSAIFMPVEHNYLA